MDAASTRNKVEAIYELREAVEAKVNAEHALAETGSSAARDTLLTALLDVEAKTQDVIEACHECGEHHAVGDDHAITPRRAGAADNVIVVDFRARTEPA